MYLLFNKQRIYREGNLETLDIWKLDVIPASGQLPRGGKAVREDQKGMISKKGGKPVELTSQNSEEENVCVEKDNHVPLC